MCAIFQAYWWWHSLWWWCYGTFVFTVLIGFLRSHSSKKATEGDSQGCLPESFTYLHSGKFWFEPLWNVFVCKWTLLPLAKSWYWFETLFGRIPFEHPLCFLGASLRRGRGGGQPYRQSDRKIICFFTPSPILWSKMDIMNLLVLLWSKYCDKRSVLT